MAGQVPIISWSSWDFAPGLSGDRPFAPLGRRDFSASRYLKLGISFDKKGLAERDCQDQQSVTSSKAISMRENSPNQVHLICRLRHNDPWASGFSEQTASQ
jgi:hypothetical protein